MKYSAQYEGQKSSVCYSTDTRVMENDESTLNVCQLPNGNTVLREQKASELDTIQQDATINFTKCNVTMFDSFFSAYFIFARDK